MLVSVVTPCRPERWFAAPGTSLSSTIIDDLFGVGCFVRPGPTEGEVVRATLPVRRPAAVMPFLEALRPQLEHRGPAFWTWKTAREAIAVRLQGLDSLTIEAAR